MPGVGIELHSTNTIVKLKEGTYEPDTDAMVMDGDKFVAEMSRVEKDRQEAAARLGIVPEMVESATTLSSTLATVEQGLVNSPITDEARVENLRKLSAHREELQQMANELASKKKRRRGKRGGKKVKERLVQAQVQPQSQSQYSALPASRRNEPIW